MPAILDRREHFDERSRAYGIAPLLAATAPGPRRRRVWTTRATPLDQGSEGACVGFGFAGELAAQPRVHTVDDPFALRLYGLAREQDRAMGNTWAVGASLLAGAKACQALGLIGQYRWAFGVDQVVDAIVGHGPVVLGIPWYSGMYETGPGGLVSATGQKVGGHAIMAHGYLPSHPVLGGEVVAWTNSWGAGYGLRGAGYVRLDTLARLLGDGGEACVPTDLPPGPPNPGS